MTKLYSSQASSTSVSDSPDSTSKSEWLEKKEEQAKLRKRQNDLARTEAEIHKLETRNEEIDNLLILEEIYTNPPELIKLNQEKTDLTKKLEELYEQWEELAE